jgi:hypothetical protein
MNATMVTTLAFSGLFLSGCAGWEISSSVSTVDTVVESDWDRDPWRDHGSWHDHDDHIDIGDTRPAHERVGPGTGHGGCDMVVDPTTGRIRSTCAGGFAGQLANSSFVMEAIRTEAKTRRVAEKYALPMEAAEKLAHALEDGKAGRSDIVTALGLTTRDVRQMVVKGEATSESIASMSEKLALSPTMTKELVSRIVSETKAQMADVESPAWKACRAGGRWKTNANAGTCKSTAWAGCSPESGALFCAAVK